MKGCEDLYSIILPTFNEAQNLPVIVYLIQKVCTEKYESCSHIAIELIIVEDNSPDGTLAIARQLQQMHHWITILSRQKKMGLGSAYRDGLEKVSGNFVIIMDADLSHHPKYIPEMIKKQRNSNADVVASTRYVGGAGVQGWTYARKFTSRVANFLATCTLGSHFSDLTGSFRLYKTQVLQDLIMAVKTKGYSFQMEILIRAWRSNKIIVEQPIVFVDRIFGKSKLGPGEVYWYLQGMILLFLSE